MALCESQLDSALPHVQSEDSSPRSEDQESPEKKPKLETNGDIYGLDQVPGGLPLSVDYRSPVSHFVPPAVELYAARQKSEQLNSTGESSETPKPIKRKRGRPRVDKTSPEYLANLAARKQAKEMAAMMNNRSNDGTPTGEKRKRGRPRVDKTSPEYLARKRARELEALERKAKREYRRRATGAKTNAKISQTPAKIRRLTKTQQGPTKTQHAPAKTQPSPAKTQQRPAKLQQRPVKPQQRPAKVQQSQTKVQQSLVKLQQSPAKLQQSPAKLQQSPAKVQQRPSKVQQRPAKVQQRPAKVQPSSACCSNVQQRPRPTKVQQKAAKVATRAVSTRVIKKIPAKVVNRQANGSATVRKIPQKVAAVRKVGDRKVIVRRNTKFIKRKDSAASSSAGESSQRVKRKYTKRAPSAKKTDTPEKVKGKRGRPRKVDQLAINRQPQQPKIRVRSNLMPVNSEPITLDSDDEPDLGSPSQASDTLSLDENLRALRHIHEKYANIDKDDLYEAHLLAANFKKPPAEHRVNRDDDEVLSIRSSEGNASVKELDTRVEKLEDSSNSDSDSSSSASGSSSSGSSSSSSSGSSSSSDSSDSESDGEDKARPEAPAAVTATGAAEDERSFGAWSHSGPQSGPGSDSDSDPERFGDAAALRAEQEQISESDNESSDKSFQCHICRKWYSTRVTLKIHRRGHQNRGGGAPRSRTRSSDRYECDCCNETFSRREKLWEHKASAHRGSMTVRCEVCRKCFEDDSELAAHERDHTADERAGRCTDCGASFQRYDQLRRHRACAHGTAPAAVTSKLPHACHQCGKRFGHAHSLTRHMHNHAKQLYRCVVCKASFARADQLAQHLNSHLANYKRLKP